MSSVVSMGRKSQFSEAEWKVRTDLAACYRLMDHFGIRDLTYNHLSARVPGEPDAIIVKPADVFFSEVTASSLEKFRLDGTPLYGADKPAGSAVKVIHAGLMRLRPEVNAVFHTHSVANMAVGCDPRGLMTLCQQAMLFHDRISYHLFEGFEFDEGMEENLERDLGSNQVMLLRNHGALIASPTVPEAFVLHHFLEISCQVQVAVSASGVSPIQPAKAVSERGARVMDQVGATANGGKNWGACLRLADRLFPDYTS